MPVSSIAACVLHYLDAAGDGVEDQELESQVAEQTDSNLEVEGAFEREHDRAATDEEIAKASGDDLA